MEEFERESARGVAKELTERVTDSDIQATEVTMTVCVCVCAALTAFLLSVYGVCAEDGCRGGTCGEARRAWQCCMCLILIVNMVYLSMKSYDL